MVLQPVTTRGALADAVLFNSYDNVWIVTVRLALQVVGSRGLASVNCICSIPIGKPRKDTVHVDGEEAEGDTGPVIVAPPWITKAMPATFARLGGATRYSVTGVAMPVVLWIMPVPSTHSGFGAPEVTHSPLFMS